MFLVPLQHILVSWVAKWSICWQFAVAKLEITTFRNIKAHRSESSNDPFALSVAEWWVLSVSASTPIVNFASVKVNMRGKIASVWWKWWRSILSFLVLATLHKRHYFLMRKISDIVKRCCLARSWRFQCDRLRHVYIAFMSFYSINCWSIVRERLRFVNIMLDLFPIWLFGTIFLSGNKVVNFSFCHEIIIF